MAHIQYHLRCHVASLVDVLNQMIKLCQNIEPKWRIYALATLDIIGLDNGLSPVWHQAIIRTMLEYCQLDS